MSSLKISLLGPPRVELDGVPVEIRRRKGLALLAYLAVTGEAQLRDALATLFWPERSQREARATLRNELWLLKEVLGETWLDLGREAIALHRRADLWIDVEQFQQGLLAGQSDQTTPNDMVSLTHAVSLYRGDFLTGFTLPDCTDFDEWQFFQAESLRQTFSTALVRLIQAYSVQSNYETAIPYARRWLALDPLHEVAHRQLMQLYAQVGQQTAALRQYRLCVQALQEELGVSPSPETTALFERIGTGDLSRGNKGTRGHGDVETRRHEEIESHLVAASPLPPHNLSPQPTPFIGREKELTDIARRLKDPTCRLLTLVGPGGIGKTRLSIQAAQTLIYTIPAEAAFRHGILFVPLTAISLPSGMVSAIAETANFTFYSNTPPQQQLLDYLREKEMLVVLDNFEHLLSPQEGKNAGAVDLITEILAAAPALKILVTSREGLNVQEEWRYPLQGLDLPAGDRDETESSLDEYSAVRLFVQSAQRVRPNFSLEAEAEEVLRICRLVEGMPLGLELAAAWVKVLPCAKIAAEIESSLDFLSSSLRNVPARHRSMRAVFEQSWQRLSEAEQAVLRRLSVFRGGFRRKAAEQVAGASLPMLAGLVDKSLISLTPEGRYHMHELLRQFSADKLDEVPAEQAATRERHSVYFLAFLQERESGLKGKQQRVVLDEIQAEIENVRATWNWAVEQGQVEAIDRALDSFYQFYRLRSHFQEGEEAFRRAAEYLQALELRSAAPERTPIEKLFMKALARQGAFCIQMGRYDLAGDLLQNSLALARRWKIQAEIAFCLLFLGDVAWKQEDYINVEHTYRESLTICQAVGHHLGMAEALARLGWLTTATKGDHLTAQSYYEQGLALLRQIENQSGIAFLLDSLGGNAFWVGKYPESEEYFQECLALFKEIGNRHGIGKALGGLGLVAWGYGGARLSEAKQLLEESLAICREIGHRSEIEQRLVMLGHITNSMGRYKEAQRYFEEAWDLSKQISQTFTASWTLSGLGEAALGLGNLQAAKHYLLEALETTRIPAALLAMMSWAMLLKKEADLPMASAVSDQEALANHERRKRAVEILSLVTNHPATWQVFKDKAAYLLAELEAELPSEVFAAAKARGKSRKFEDVVVEILRETIRGGEAFLRA